MYNFHGAYLESVPVHYILSKNSIQLGHVVHARQSPDEWCYLEAIFHLQGDWCFGLSRLSYVPCASGHSIRVSNWCNACGDRNGLEKNARRKTHKRRMQDRKGNIGEKSRHYFSFSFLTPVFLSNIFMKERGIQ